MPRAQLFIISVYLLLFQSCITVWERTETESGFEWHSRPHLFYHTSPISMRRDETCFDRGGKTKIRQTDSEAFYDFDSVRIYIPTGDTTLSQLIESGVLTGQMFINKPANAYCQMIPFNFPVKFEYKGWKGYRVYLTTIREVKTVRFPNRYKRKSNSYKAFDFAYHYMGQSFVNPEDLRLELRNESFKASAADGISLTTFLEGAKVISFYSLGGEI